MSAVDYRDIFGRTYPNLHAIVQNTISGAFREWPTIRPELEELAADLAREREARLAAEREREEARADAQDYKLALLEWGMLADGAADPSLKRLSVEEVQHASQTLVTLAAAIRAAQQVLSVIVSAKKRGFGAAYLDGYVNESGEPAEVLADLDRLFGPAPQDAAGPAREEGT